MALFYYLCNSNPTLGYDAEDSAVGCDWLYFIIFATAIRHASSGMSNSTYVVIGFILLSLQQQSDTDFVYFIDTQTVASVVLK